MRASAFLPASAVLALGAAACELPETTIPGGESVVVVLAIMRPDRDAQFVVVERSFDGVIDPISQSGAIPPGKPQVPIVDATVTVENLDLPGDPCGATVTFQQGSRPTGVYWGPRGCPTMRPGDRLALRVSTPAGEVVTGTTRIPGLADASVAVGTDLVLLPADSGPEFNRDRDTLRVSVTPTGGRLLQVELRRYEDLNDWGTVITADTTVVQLPGTLVDVFETAYGLNVFVPGRSYALTAALADTNYYDYVRSSNNEITGRGFVNHLVDGAGLFGSMIAAGTRIWVVGDLDDPREGIYRLQGELLGIAVDVTLTVYTARNVEATELSAFVEGQWIRLVLVGPDGMPTWRPLAVQGFSVDGAFDGPAFRVAIETPTPHESHHLVLSGLWAEGTSFSVAVADSTGFHTLPLGTLTATQQ